MIVEAVFVKIKNGGSTKVGALMQELAVQKIYPIQFITCGGPKGTYVAVHDKNDLSAIRRIWRTINKSKDA